MKYYHQIPNTHKPLLAKNLVDVVKYRAHHQADELAYAFMNDGLNISDSLTYAQLDQEANKLASKLREYKNKSKSTTALLLFPPGLQFIKAFWACLYSGVIAVPAYPIFNTKDMARLAKIAEDCQANIVLTSSEGEKSIELWFAQNEIKGMQCICIDTIAPEPLENDTDNDEIDELAFLQYTSGSTGNPKGVMVTHNNLLHNLHQIYTSFEHDSSSIGVIWLPPYHDMGLIGGILQPVYGGFPVYLMSPFTFIKRPLIWLQAVAKYRATTSGGPNFAFQLCIKNIHKLKDELDLSSWKVAFCGAEPIRKNTLDNFSKVFASYGWNNKAIYPCYGMAESTLIATGGKAGTPLKHISVNPVALTNNVLEESEHDNASSLVSCGKGTDTKILIVDPATNEIKVDGQIGEVWLSGDSVAAGYWNNDALSTDIFLAYTRCGQGPFLRTGDLGALINDELFVTGRIKELIIINGKNFYPTDFERCAQDCSEDVRQDAGAAFACEQENGDQLIIVQEVKKEKINSLDFEKLSQSIKDAIYDEFGLSAKVLLVAQGSIPKTSSGKVKRFQMKKLYESEMIKSLELA
jgi:acyl-CoA synthetase (AMP-forming)/AMP-acid ligase II